MISVVIPVYNEAESLRQLHQEIAAVAIAEQLDVEFLFVDDGSRDSSWATIESLAESDPRVGGIRFRRNFGKAAALAAGFQAARGQYIATLDADLQDDPRELPRLLASLDADLDLVSGWKQTRHDPADKVIPSRIFNWLVSRLTGVALHDHNCGYKLYRAAVVRDLHLHGEMHRFIPVLAATRGWRVGELVVHHRKRQYGRSKYGFSRNIKGLLDLFTVAFLTRFGDRPMHAIGGCGLASLAVGGLIVVAACGAAVGQRVAPMAAWEYAPSALYGWVAAALGVALLKLGLVAELLVDNRTSSARGYSIRENRPPRKPELQSDAP